MKRKTIRVGTRGSQLALWQTHFVIQKLQRHFPGVTFETVIIKTTGDQEREKPLTQIGDKGLFTRELDEALLDGRVDLTVHSLKDIPTQLPDGITIGAIPQRGDVRDAFVSLQKKPFDALPYGATVATGSLRRRAQLRHLRPDLTIVNVRGNVPTRLEKLRINHWDGMVLAAAGLQRLQLEERITQYFPPDQMVPAVGQGALAIVHRTDDTMIAQQVSVLHHPPTAAAIQAERQFLQTLEGGCQVPIGALALVKDNELVLTGMLAGLDGDPMLKHRMEGTTQAAAQLGEQLGRWMLQHGGETILTAIREESNER